MGVGCCPVTHTRLWVPSAGCRAPSGQHNVKFHHEPSACLELDWAASVTADADGHRQGSPSWQRVCVIPWNHGAHQHTHTTAGCSREATNLPPADFLSRARAKAGSHVLAAMPRGCLVWAVYFLPLLSAVVPHQQLGPCKGILCGCLQQQLRTSMPGRTCCSVHVLYCAVELDVLGCRSVMPHMLQPRTCGVLQVYCLVVRTQCVLTKAPGGQQGSCHPSTG